MSSQTEDAVLELTRLGTNREALAALDLLEDKRRQQQFVKYWMPITDDQAKIFTQWTPDIKTFGVLGGNRSGKSELGAFIATAWALGKQYFKDEPAWEYVKQLPIPDPPNNIWVVGLTFQFLKAVLWREKLREGKDHPPFLPEDNSIRRINDSEFEIFFTNGSVITGKSADSGWQKFQGASVDFVWIDEEPEVEIFNECYQRTVDCGGRILVTLTPILDISSGVRTPWVFDLYEDFQAGKGDIRFVTLSVLDNPKVPAQEKQRLLDKWQGHPEEGARLYGKFFQRSGLVYPMWNPGKHLVKPYQLPGDRFKIVAIDPAATGITAALWVSVDPGGNLTCYREYYERDKVISDHAKDILIRNSGDRIDLWLIDPKYGAQRNAETHKTNFQLYRDSGIPVRLAPVDTDYGLNESREYLKATLEPTSRHPRAIFFNDLTNFREEIEHYIYDVFQRGDNRGMSKDKPRKRNDHLMNAFQYICGFRPRGRGNAAREFPADYSKFNSYTTLPGVPAQETGLGTDPGDEFYKAFGGR